MFKNCCLLSLDLKDTLQIVLSSQNEYFSLTSLQTTHMRSFHSLKYNKIPCKHVKICSYYGVSNAFQLKLLKQAKQQPCWIFKGNLEKSTAETFPICFWETWKMRNKTSRKVNRHFNVLLMPNALVKQSVVFSSAACCPFPFCLLFIGY